MERLRAIVLRTRGGQVGGGVLIGLGARVDRPFAVALGARCQLEPGVWIKVVTDAGRVSVGEYSFLGRGTELDCAESIVVGRHVLVAPGVFITDHSHGIALGTPVATQPCPAKAVVIEDDVWLGAHSVVLPGVRIGSGAVVAAGAVVTREVAPRAIVAGVPARLLRYRE
jgi:acetyltransferase-like isoleucine patch superfamily enzyme